MLFDLDEMRKSHAKIQSHQLLGVLLAEAAQGVKEGRMRRAGPTGGQNSRRSKTSGTHRRSTRRAPPSSRFCGRASYARLSRRSRTSSSRSPQQKPAGGKPRGAYGATAAAAAHKMGYRPRDVAALGRSVADAGDRVASASGLARLPHQRMWSSSRGGDPARGEMTVEPTLRTQAPRRWCGLRGAARRASPQRDAEGAEGREWSGVRRMPVWLLLHELGQHLVRQRHAGNSSSKHTPCEQRVLATDCHCTPGWYHGVTNRERLVQERRGHLRSPLHVVHELRRPKGAIASLSQIASKSP